jgi:conjugative transfer signal peptidase TraF
MKLNKQRLFCLCASIAVLFVSLYAICEYYGLRVNTTPSVPLGMYRITNSPNSTYVAFCLKGVAAQIANQRGYRPRSVVGCPDGYAPLIKPVAAREGDTVTVDARGISVNGVLLKNTVILDHDSGGRPMFLKVPFGTYKVAPGTIWPVSTYNTKSFDGRYFGPLATKDILYHAEPFWTF